MAKIGQKNYANYRHYFVDNLARFYKKKKSRVYGGAVLTLITISFFAFFALKPTANTIAGLFKKIDDQKQVVQALEAKINTLAQAQEQYNLMSNRVYLLDQTLPQESQFSLLAQQLEFLARQAQVEIIDLKFSEIDLWGQESNQIQEVKFTFVAQGEYSRLKELLRLFPKLRRLIKTEKFAFQKNQSKEKEATLSLSVQGKAFYLKETKGDQDGL